MLLSVAEPGEAPGNYLATSGSSKLDLSPLVLTLNMFYWILCRAPSPMAAREGGISPGEFESDVLSVPVAGGTTDWGPWELR